MLDRRCLLLSCAAVAVRGRGASRASGGGCRRVVTCRCADGALWRADTDAAVAGILESQFAGASARQRWQAALGRNLLGINGDKGEGDDHTHRHLDVFLKGRAGK